MNRSRTILALAVVAMVSMALTATAASAAVITINNADFAADNGGDWTVVPDWNEGANSWTYDPSGSNQLLYLNQTGKVDQDLSHNWSLTDTYTLSLIGQDPGWNGVGEAFSVQLRQTDGTVLWDSGSTSVDGLTDGQPFNWTIDASTDFTGGTVDQQLNIQLQCTAGGSVFIDDVSLSVVPEPATMSLLALGGLAMLRRRRSRS